MVSDSSASALPTRSPPISFATEKDHCSVCQVDTQKEEAYIALRQFVLAALTKPDAGPVTPLLTAVNPLSQSIEYILVSW